MDWEPDETIKIVPDHGLSVHSDMSYLEERLGPRPVGLTDEVIEYVAGLLARRYTKTQVKEELASILGVEKSAVSTRLIETCLRWARVWLRANFLERTLDDHIAQGIAMLEADIQDPSNSAHIRIKAQRVLNNMLGIGDKFSNSAYDPEQTAAITRRLLGEMDDCVESSE